MATATDEKTTESKAQSAQSVGALPPEPDETKAESKRREAANEVVNELAELPFDQLARLRDAVAHALTQKGKEPSDKVAAQETDKTGVLPSNPDRAEELTKDGKLDKVAKLVDADEDEVLDFNVRQARNSLDQPTGPAYLRVALADGTRRVVELD
jgi:hypothetical protein